ncbi:MAG: caspase family protein, partial [Marinirhabdus sp.]|nr:caspase family protein [Marinirhabdus sp.]
MKQFFLLIGILFFQYAIAQKAELVIPTGHANSITSMAESANGKIMATASLDKTVKVYLKSSMKELFFFDVGFEPRAVAVSSDGKFVVGATTTKMKVANVQTGKLIKEFENRQGAGMAFHPTRPEFYFSTYTTGTLPLRIQKFDLNTSRVQELFQIPVIGDQKFFVEYSTQISADGTLLFLPKNNLVVNLQTKQYHNAKGLYMLPDGHILDYTIHPDTKVLTLMLRSNTGNVLWEKPMPNLTENWYNLYNSIGVNGDWVIINFNTQNVLRWNYKTKEYLFQPRPDGVTSPAILLSNNHEMVMANKEGGLFKVHPSTLDITESYTFPSPYPAKRITGAKDANIIALAGDYPHEEPLKIARFSKQGIAFDNGDAPIQVSALGLSNDGKKIAVGLQYDWLMTDTDQPKTTSALRSPVGTPSSFSFSDDGTTFYIQAPDGYSMYSTGSRSPKKTVNKPYSFVHFYNHIADVSSNGDRIAGYFAEKETHNGTSVNQLRVYEGATGTLKWAVDGEFQKVRYSEGDQMIIAVQRKPAQVVTFDANTGARKNALTIPNSSNGVRTAISKSGRFVTWSNGSQLSVYDTETGKVFNNTKLMAKQERLVYFGDDFLVAIESDQLVRLYDGTNSKLLATLVMFKNDEWAVMTQDGHFEASKGAMSSMYYRVGDATVKLEQFYEPFYTPGLLGQLLTRTFSPESDINIDDVKSPPEISISYAEGSRNLVVEDDEALKSITTENSNAKITLNARAKQGAISEVRLFHNGKLVANNARNLVVEDDVNQAQFSKTFNIQLLPGENTFRAIALNNQRTESNPAQIVVQYNEPKVVKNEKPSGGIQLHLVVVGINAYKNPKYNLNYAKADAESFKQSLEAGMKGITSTINTYFIKDSDANRSSILKTFETIKDIANPQDVFVFYYAGHGVMSEGDKKDFYLVPYDVTQLYGNDGGLKEKGISATELKALASQILAQKQLYVLDACQSAGALNAMAARGAAEEKAIAQLARSTGTHWLTASGSEQFATEFDELGH